MMRILALSVIVGLALTSVASADPRREATRWVEDFANPQNHIQQTGADWETSVGPEGLRLLGTDPQAPFRFHLLAPPRFSLIAENYLLEADISTSVHLGEGSTGGAGLILGTRDRFWTIAFTLSKSGRFDIMRFDAEGGTLVASGEYRTVEDGPHALSLIRDGGILRFMIDGTEVFSIDEPELEPQTLYSGPGPYGNLETPVQEGGPHFIDRILEPGIAVWGSGDFLFSEIALTPTSATLDSIDMTLPLCGLTPPESGSRLFHVSLARTPALASASTDGADAVTYYAEIDIAPSNDRLSLILSSDAPMIWVFSGATQDIAHVSVVGPISQAGHVAAGITGLAPDDISFHAIPDCLQPARHTDSTEAEHIRTVVENQMGRAADEDMFFYSEARIALPEGAALEQSAEALSQRLDDRDGPPGLMARAIGFGPGGVVAVDPEAVVSPGPVQPYAVLPREWGLLELIAMGLIEDVTMAEDYSFDARFRIIGPVPMFPPGLSGAHSVTFERPAGMPMPGGSPGHSKVIDIP